MESPAQKASRLLDALDDLVGQEGMYLRGGFYDLAVEVRHRTAPLVDELVAMSTLPEVAQLGGRVDVLLQRSAAHQAYLQAKIAELAGEIQRTEQARFRATRLAPAYRSARGARLPRFQAAG